MTKPAHQDTPVGVSAFSRTRRAAAAVAFSLGLGSLVYGTVLSLPASAAAGTGTGVSCTSSPTSTATATGTATGTDTPTASSSDTAAAGPADASQSAGASASASGTGTSTDTPTATATGTGDCTTGTATTTGGATGTTTPTGAGSATASTTATNSATETPTPSKSVTKIPGKGSPTAKPPTGGRSSVPVYVVAPTGSYSYFTYTDVPPGDASYQLPHGTISRAQIMARAALWVQQEVPYSQTEWHTNQNGTYRQDCSGYVSMAWDLDQNTDFWTGNLNLVSQTIPAAQLLPGDILLSDEHTILFAGWANPEHTSFDYYEEAHPGTVARFVEDAPLAAFLDNGFATFRYDGVVDSADLPANPNGDLYSQLTQQGSEIHPSGVVPGWLRGLDDSTSASATAKLAAQSAADVSASDAHTGGEALGVGGAFLLGGGLLMRRPVIQARRRRH